MVRVHASGQSHRDFLQQPAVAVRIAERGERGITAPLRIRAAERRLSRTGTVDHFAHVDAATDELGTRGHDIGHDEVKSACRARWGRGDPFAEVDRARRAWRRELYDPKLVTDREVGVEPPTHA